jgi:hypothetical protein
VTIGTGAGAGVPNALNQVQQAVVVSPLFNFTPAQTSFTFRYGVTLLDTNDADGVEMANSITATSSDGLFDVAGNALNDSLLRTPTTNPNGSSGISVA